MGTEEKGHKTDYKELGFRAGLEIHQQLEGKKLFCSCPTAIRKDKPDFTVERRLRASAGETGEVDIAAAHEQQKGKEFNYQGYKDTTCLVELDEEPPHPVNEDALKTALQVAKLLNARIVDRIQFMRKTVIDGSNTSGFQRTALIARDGHIEVNGNKITIPTICLEEEACQVIERKKDRDVYNLSRLGIPLIEIATGPDIESPEECREAAAKLGMILRSVKGMKRGIGSIRQDVNMSIKGGARVEVKGFQDYKAIPKVIENEVKRQLKLVKSGKKPEEEVRKAEPDFTTSYLRPMPGAARMYPETDVMIVKPENVKTGKVELIEEKAEKLKEAGLGDDLANKIAKTGKTDLVLGLIEEYKNIKPAFIGETMISFSREILRQNKSADPSRIKEDQLKEVFSALDNGRITKDSVMSCLTDIAEGRGLDLEKYSLMTDKELEKEIKKIISENKGKPEKAMIGIAMGKLKGKADPKKIVEMLNRLK
ncbi:MAG: Glu-tRNA(Gln) amidotransferase subunit GatE [Candidatus Woesearchaeota archaeon]